MAGGGEGEEENTVSLSKETKSGRVVVYREIKQNYLNTMLHVLLLTL